MSVMNAPLTNTSVNYFIDQAIGTPTSDEDPLFFTKRALNDRGLVLCRVSDFAGWSAMRTFLLSRAEKKDGTDNGQAEISRTDPMSKLSMHFGMMIRKVDNDNTELDTCCGVVTFFFGYSTWDGRILYVDSLEYDDTKGHASDKDQGTGEAVEIAMLQTLAYVAVHLDCSRLTWRVSDTCAPDGSEPLMCHSQ